jgi:acyl-coenzyme A thioesterase PaaI-like protein
MSDSLTPVQAAVVPDGFIISPWQRGFGRTVGPFFHKDDLDGSRVMAFRVEEHHANGMNNCHGGMLMSFADMAWGQGIMGAGKYNGWVSGAQMGDWVEGASDMLAEQDDIFTFRGRLWCGDRTIMTGMATFKGIRGEFIHNQHEQAKA